MTIGSFNRSFKCCETILHDRYPKIGLGIEPLVSVNVSVQEKVRIMRAKRERFMEVLDSYYVYLPDR